MNSTTRSEEASQRGAVAVIVGIMMVVLLGSTALAVDLGAKRATDGRVVTAADASALTEAQKLSQGLSTSAACNAARAVVTANEPGSTGGR